jgi:hypothetical protein
MGGSDEQHREESSMAKLLRLSLATPHVSCFLLLDDPANELFLSVGLGTESHSSNAVGVVCRQGCHPHTLT